LLPLQKLMHCVCWGLNVHALCLLGFECSCTNWLKIAAAFRTWKLFETLLQHRWTFGIVEPWFSCYIWRWLPKCGFFKTAPGRFWKGGFRGRLLVFLKSETDRGRLYVFGYMVPVKMMSHVKKNKNLPHTLLPPHFFEYTLGVYNRVELFRFDQNRNGGLK
jgi:hypothetical protein